MVYDVVDEHSTSERGQEPRVLDREESRRKAAAAIVVRNATASVFQI